MDSVRRACVAIDTPWHLALVAFPESYVQICGTIYAAPLGGQLIRQRGGHKFK